MQLVHEEHYSQLLSWTFAIGLWFELIMLHEQITKENVVCVQFVFEFVKCKKMKILLFLWIASLTSNLLCSILTNRYQRHYYTKVKIKVNLPTFYKLLSLTLDNALHTNQSLGMLVAWLLKQEYETKKSND